MLFRSVSQSRYVCIDDEDELGSFVFRTTGFNSIRTLSTRLRYFAAASGELLSTLPLELRLRGKSTTQSHRAPIYYVDLTVRTGMTMAESIAKARTLADERKASGFNQDALDEAAKLGFENGAFEDSEEEGVAVVEEFYSDVIPTDNRDKSENKSDLATKLGKKVEQLNLAEASIQR